MFCQRTIAIRPAAAPIRAHWATVRSRRVRCQTNRNRVVENIDTPCTIESSTTRYKTRKVPAQRSSVERSATARET